MKTCRIDLVFPRFKLLSGAERAILGLASALNDDGHHVRIVCHQFDASCRPRLPQGIALVCTDARLDWSGNRYVNAISDYARVFGLRHYLDHTADLCLLFGPALLLALYRRWVKKSQGRTLYYCWEPPRALYQDRDLVLARLGWRRVAIAPLLALYARVDRALVTGVDVVCTSSSFAAAQIEMVYGRPASVITLGVDRERLDSVGEQRLQPPPVVITVNYLHPRKRVDLVLQTAVAVGERWSGGEPLPRWIIIGDGPERSRLETLAQELGVAERVQFAGFVSDEQLPRYYAGAHCYIHTALKESFGLSVIEAAYSGCPVVAVDEGGVRQTVEDGVTGFLVSPSPAALASAVCDILTRSDGGRGMGAAGRQRVSQAYRWQRGAEEIVSLVEDRR